MTSTVTLLTGGLYCPPCPPLTLTVQQDLVGTIVEEEILTGTVVEEENLIGLIVEDCEAPAFDVLTLALDVPAPIEIGTVFGTPGFTATYIRPPSAAVLTNTDNGEAKDVIATPGAFSSDLSYARTTPGSVTWTLTADDGGAPDAQAVAKAWQAKLITGWTTFAGPYTEAQLLALNEFTDPLDPDGLFQVSLTPVNAYLVAVYHDSFNGAVPTDFQIGTFLPGGAAEIQTGLSMAIPGGSGLFSVARSNLIQNAAGLNWQRLS